ncbi:MAG: glutathione S-transferase N-terminal domain-containing protein, partial [Parvibaculum sp.]|nr:glutathione S-transferase N-terminal domain-containing protein [Parvibaculum sp.]
MAELRLHNFFRNSAGHRVRIALALKGLDYDYVPVNIGPASEQKSESYLRLNPQGLVPTLEHKGAVITQSSAIIEYLEEIFPDPALLPA